MHDCTHLDNVKKNKKNTYLFDNFKKNLIFQFTKNDIIILEVIKLSTYSNARDLAGNPRGTVITASACARRDQTINLKHDRDTMREILSFKCIIYIEFICKRE